MRHCRSHDAGRPNRTASQSPRIQHPSISADGFENSISAEEQHGIMPLQTTGEDAGFSALILAAQQHQLMPLGSTATPFLNDHSMGDGPLGAIVASSGLINASPGTRMTDSNAYTVPSISESTSGLDNQLPYWGFGGDDFDSLSFVNTEGFEDLNLSFLNAIGEYPLQPVLGVMTEEVRDTSVPPPNLESRHPHERTGSEKETAIQRSWYTYVGHVPSGDGTLEPVQPELQVDEDRRRDLTTRLQPRVQPGSLPSTSFLVSRHSMDQSAAAQGD